MEKPSVPFTPPPLQLVRDLIRPYRNWFDPQVYGLEKLEKDRPALYVSNHTVYGLTDGFFLGAEAYEKKGVFIRSLVDNAHLSIPVWRKIIEDLGMVPGSRAVCHQLMEAGAHIMVFPGGTREAFKHKGEAYHLTWKNRLGFARMAVAHEYDIMPVASVGGEEMYTILWDNEEIMASPFGQFLKVTGISKKYFKEGEYIPPITKGIGWTGLPRPERLYIKVGDRISTKGNADRAGDEQFLMEVRNAVSESLSGMLAELQEIRAHDERPEEWWRKMLRKL